MTPLPAPYYQTALGTLYHGDCLEVMRQLPAYSVPLVVTDPPYSFSLSSCGNGKLNPWGDVVNCASWFAAWMSACFRLLQNDGALWQFCSWRTLPSLTKATFDIGHQIESCCVWDKQWIGPGGQRGLRPSYELIALICQDSFALANRGLPDIKRSQWSSIKPNGHPAEKPLPLVKWLIEESNKPLVMDPFMGSGTTALACEETGRRWIGIELDERWCELTVKRLKQPKQRIMGV